MESGSLSPNIMPGWKIRVCSEKTKADQINFKFTPTGSKSSYGTGASGSSSSGIGGTGASDSAMGAANPEQSTSWTRGEATEINVPSELRQADKLRIEATPSQKDKKASICLVMKMQGFQGAEARDLWGTKGNRDGETGECTERVRHRLERGSPLPGILFYRPIETTRSGGSGT
jgi:hypothetical protein